MENAGRILRTLASVGAVEEAEVESYVPTTVSWTMIVPKLAAGLIQRYITLPNVIKTKFQITNHLLCDTKGRHCLL